MAKIRGKDFAKTVVITPEESDAIKKRAGAVPRAATDRRKRIERRNGAERRNGIDRRVVASIKGPRKGLGGWSIFLLVVVGLVACIGIVVMLAHYKVLPTGL